ncbi:MAG: VOC family protein [Hyphomicrobiaceae bacterium]|nr:VOC family protein [Hyphomicrobiaceae bacterium]
MNGLRFDHVHLRCSDLEATARFFETMFGAEVSRDTYPQGTLYPGQPRIILRVGGQRIPLAPKHPTAAMAAPPPFPYYGVEHIGFTVDDVDAAVAELVAKGAEIAVGPLTRQTGTRLAFVRGPDGIMVELVARARAS